MFIQCLFFSTCSQYESFVVKKKTLNPQILKSTDNVDLSQKWLMLVVTWPKTETQLGVSFFVEAFCMARLHKNV